MNNDYERYLKAVDKCLSKIAVSKKIDLLQLAKKEIVKKGKDNSYEELKKEFGIPEDFVKSLLAKKETKLNHFSHSLIFYLYTFFTGIFVVPILGILGPTFMACAWLCPILGLIKLISFLISVEVPFLSFYLISFELHPLFVFPFTLLFGIFFWLLGKKCWNLLKQYLNFIKTKYESL